MASAPVSLSAASARRLALRAQGLDGARPGPNANRGHLRAVMRRIELLQLDSVPVVDRTQYLVLFSRLGAYRRDLLDDVAYKRDEWFEAWAHEASLLPVETEPLLRWAKERARQGEMWRVLRQLAQEEPGYIDEVLAQVAERGPLGASELDDPRPQQGEWWGSRSLGSWALDYLFRIGAVGIRRVGNFEKRFDLLERIIPAEILARPTPSENDAISELLVRSAQALGIGTTRCLVDYFRVPKRLGRALVGELAADGRLEPVHVQGMSEPSYLVPGTSIPRRVAASTLVSPFDPIVWQRERASAYFGFDYKIEIYVPKDKRHFGYYVLPFLLGDRFVGRADIKTNRETKLLEVHGAFIEPGADADAVVEPLRSALSELARFVGANDYVVTGEARGELSQALR